MHVRRLVCGCAFAGLSLAAFAQNHVPACKLAAFEGEVDAGKPFSQVIGNGLKLYLQPIRSGWILRVLPVAGSMPEHDYAELATPPYQSVTPLSISTDFAFRAQDAIGWNPRRFHFASSTAAYNRFYSLYGFYQQAVAMPPSPGRSNAMAKLEQPIGVEIAKSAEGTLTILDSRLVPGIADQWRMAAAVASHFSETAHTVVQGPDVQPTPLGRLVWLRFRVALELPPGFKANPAMHLLRSVCNGT